MRAEHASDLPDRYLEPWKLLAQVGGDPLGLLGRLRVHDAHVLDRKIAAEVLDHPRDGAGASANAVDGLDLAIGDEEERLQVEHRADHRLRAAHPSAPLDVAKGGEPREG